MIFPDFPGFPWKFPAQIVIDSIVTRHEPVCQISARCDYEKWVYESVENSKERNIHIRVRVKGNGLSKNGAPYSVRKKNKNSPTKLSLNRAYV